MAELSLVYESVEASDTTASSEDKSVETSDTTASSEDKYVDSTDLSTYSEYVSKVEIPETAARPDNNMFTEKKSKTKKVRSLFSLKKKRSSSKETSHFLLENQPDIPEQNEKQSLKAQKSDPEPSSFFERADVTSDLEEMDLSEERTEKKEVTGHKEKNKRFNFLFQKRKGFKVRKSSSPLLPQETSSKKKSLKNLFNRSKDSNIKESEKESKELAKSSTEGLLEKIGTLITPKVKDVEELHFDMGHISAPKHGIPQKEVDVTYEITKNFQYANVSFDGEELKYTSLEPPMSEGEWEYLRVIENAFDKMTHSDIVVIQEDERKEALKERFNTIIEIYRLDLTEFQKEKMFYYLLKKYIGYAKLDLLMRDPFIEDITCNGPGMPIYINHRIYGSITTDVIFEEVELNNFVMKVAQSSGRHISVLEPIRDASLKDGSRANLTLGKEVTKKGSTFTIRRFRSNPVSCIDLINYGTFDAHILAYLWIIIEYKRSVLAAGGTASGKTTTLNALGSFIRPEYKIVSIEDTAEMNLMHPNWTQSVTRAGFGGKGANNKAAGDVELYDLLAAALRQRPEYIIVGEVRGAEAGTLFQAISVGHPCMGTIHAGSIKELVSRVESKPMEVPRNLFSSLDAVIFNSMIKVGEHFIRRVMRIVEIVEVDPERGDLITNPAWKWDPVTDSYEFTGYSALFEHISEEFGIDNATLVKEMDDRATLLNWMSENSITDYESVAKTIRKYSRNKDAMMEGVN